MKEIYAIQIYNLKRHYDYVVSLYESQQRAREMCKKFNADFTKDNLLLIAKVRIYTLILGD